MICKCKTSECPCRCFGYPIILVLLCCFAIWNLTWLTWRHVAYSKYTEGMVETAMSTALVPRYVAKDSDGFDYSVKYPDYLSLTGNLAVGFPGTEEDPYTDSLIIWPKFSGGYEYGVILDSLEEGGDGFMFYIDTQGNAIEDEYRQVSEKYEDVIAELLERVGGYWGAVGD